MNFWCNRLRVRVPSKVGRVPSEDSPDPPNSASAGALFSLYRRHIAAFIASGEMVAAYFIGHFPKSFWPFENAGEPAVLFCFIFLYMATQSSGIWSVDAARGR